MIKAVFYKEWIKTKWCSLLSLILSIGFVVYTMLRIARVCSLKGVEHVIIVMLQRDAIFIDLLQYVPLIIGLSFAIVQFVPEMHHKSFKLTLHLPIKTTNAVNAMLFFGLSLLIVIFSLSLLIMWIYLQDIMVYELWQRIILSALPWYLSGIAAYLLSAWIVMEPTWKHRIINGIIAILLLRLYFMAPAPEAYNDFLPFLAVITLLYGLLTMLSVTRFRNGMQD